MVAHAGEQRTVSESTPMRFVRSDVEGPRSRRLAVWALEIWALSAFAIAQPLFAVLGDEATFFVVHRASTAAIVTLVLVLTLGVPAVLFGVECIVEATETTVVRLWRRGRGPETRDGDPHRDGQRHTPRVSPVVHTLILGGLASAVVVPPLSRSLGLGAAPWMTALVVVAVVVAFMLARFVVLRRVVRYAAFAPVLFAVLFLFLSPVSALIGGSTTTASSRTVDGATEGDRSTLGPGNVDTPPVVWMILDEFPLSMIVGSDEEIVADRFPNLARLASMSTFYPSYTAGAVFTERAVPSILTGRWPKDGQLPIASQHPQNLFTILAGPDYPVTAYESVTELCPPDVCEDRPEREPIPLWGDTWAVYLRYLLPGTVADRFVGRIDQNWADFDRAPAAPAKGPEPTGSPPDTTPGGSATSAGGPPANAVEGSPPGSGNHANQVAIDDETTRWAELAEMVPDFNGNVDLFDRFVAPLGDPDLAGLHYLHMRLPHGPIRYLPDGRKYVAYFEPRTGEFTQWPDDEPTMRTIMHRAVLQAMFADHLVGEMLDALERSGNLERTAIVVASDHGASFRPGVATRSMDSPDAALDSVPSLLLIKAPDQTRARVDVRRAQQVDILPTVLELVGMHPHDRDTATTEPFDGLAMTDRHADEWAQRIVVRAGDGDPFEYRSPPVVTDSPTIEWIRQILPDPTRPYAVGPIGGLVGLADDGVRQTSSGYSLTLDWPTMFDDVVTDPTTVAADDFGHLFLPALITGVIDGATSPVHVAAVVNGRIAGVGESFTFEGTQRISILIDPDALTSGRNDVSFITVPVGATPKGADEWEQLATSGGA